MCQSELDERANCLRIGLIKPQQKWFFLSVEYQNTKLPIKTPVQSLLKRTQSREAVVPVAPVAGASRGLTSKGKLLGRALGLNAYAHAVCIVWHWSAPAITAQGPSIKNVSDFFFISSTLRHVTTFSLFSTSIFSSMFELFPLNDFNVIYGQTPALLEQ